MVMYLGDYATKSVPGSQQAPGTRGSYEEWLSQAKKAARRGINLKMPQQFNPYVTGGWGGTQSGRYTYADIGGGGVNREAAYNAAVYGAQAAGLDEQISGLEGVLAEASKYGDDINALWGGVEDALKKEKAKAIAALEAGGDPEAIKAGYENARREIEGAIEAVTGIYNDLGAEIDAEMQTAPYDARRRLSLMKETIMQPLNEHLTRTADLMQRTGSGGSVMPMTRALMEEAIGAMTPYVGGEITAAADARRGLLGQKQQIGTWYGGQRAGLGRDKAGLYEREGTALSDLSMRKAEGKAGVIGNYSSRMLDAKRGQSTALGSALTAKTNAMTNLAGLEGAKETALGMSAAQRLLPTSTRAGLTRSFANTSGSLSSTGTKGVGSANVSTIKDPIANALKTNNPYATKGALTAGANDARKLLSKRREKEFGIG